MGLSSKVQQTGLSPLIKWAGGKEKELFLSSRIFHRRLTIIMSRLWVEGQFIPPSQQNDIS